MMTDPKPSREVIAQLAAQGVPVLDLGRHFPTTTGLAFPESVDRGKEIDAAIPTQAMIDYAKQNPQNPTPVGLARHISISVFEHTRWGKGKNMRSYFGYYIQGIVNLLGVDASENAESMAYLHNVMQMHSQKRVHLPGELTSPNFPIGMNPEHLSEVLPRDVVAGLLLLAQSDDPAAWDQHIVRVTLLDASVPWTVRRDVLVVKASELLFRLQDTFSTPLMEMNIAEVGKHLAALAFVIKTLKAHLRLDADASEAISDYVKVGTIPNMIEDRITKYNAGIISETVSMHTSLDGIQDGMC